MQAEAVGQLIVDNLVSTVDNGAMSVQQIMLSGLPWFVCSYPIKYVVMCR